MPPHQVILFVCTGNTCRSPMAEHLLRLRLGGVGSVWRPASAGLAARAGAPASLQAIQVMREIGADLSAHRACPLDAAMIDGARWIVVMTREQEQEIRRRYPHRSVAVRLLESFSTGPPRDVPDPFGGSESAYRELRERMEGAIADMVLFLREPSPGNDDGRVEEEGGTR